MSTPGSAPVSALAQTMIDALKATPQHFHDMADTHSDVPWREFLLAWGELRAADILKRDDDGHYYIE